MDKTVRRRASQSATEYLLTYGWMIVLVILVSAVLVFLGVFSPFPYRGYSGLPRFVGHDFDLSVDGDFYLYLSAKGNPVEVTDMGINCTGEYVNEGFSQRVGRAMQYFEVSGFKSSNISSYECDITIYYKDTKTKLTHTDFGKVWGMRSPQGKPQTVTLTLDSGLSFQDEGTMEYNDTVNVSTDNSVYGPTVSGTVIYDYYATGSSGNWFDALTLRFTSDYSPDDYNATLRLRAMPMVSPGAWSTNCYNVTSGYKDSTHQDSSPSLTYCIDMGNSQTWQWFEYSLPSSDWSQGSFWLTLRLWDARIDYVELKLQHK